jgi:hypothetical protein
MKNKDTKRKEALERLKKRLEMFKNQPSKKEETLDDTREINIKKIEDEIELLTKIINGQGA